MERPLPHSNPTDRSAVGDLLKPTEVAPRPGVSQTRLYAAAEDNRIPRRADRRSGRIAALRSRGHPPVGGGETGRAPRHVCRDCRPDLPDRAVADHACPDRLADDTGRFHAECPRGRRRARARDRRLRVGRAIGAPGRRMVVAGSLPAGRGPRGSTRDWPSIARDRGPDVSRRSGHSRRPSRSRVACPAADAAIPTPS